MARTEGQWKKGTASVQPIADLPILLQNDYLNFGGVISGDLGYGIRDNDGVIEFKDDAGVWTPFSSGVTPNPTWEFYATNWSTEPTFNKAITGGVVFDYTLDGVTRYRFVADPYDPETDAFYETFLLDVLSDLIVTRG